MSIKIGEYILRDSILEYPDGSIIDLKKASVTNIGIMPEDEKWVVTLLTKAAIYRLQNNSRDSLEVIGFAFRTFNEASIAHNIFCRVIFKVEDGEDEKEGEINENDRNN